jgi:catechol 2,3-dioxygenase-like lactoylglutathione lyase family enzyme
MPPIASVAAVVADCAAAAPMAEFYSAACGGQVVRSQPGSVWLQVGELLVIFREVPGYQPPTWPEAGVPMQVHLDFWVDDLAVARDQLHELGAVTVAPQPPGEGLIVMRDPAGHLFCICQRQ